MYLCEYETFADVVTGLPFFLEEVYNQQILYSALGCQSPKDFEETLLIGQTKALLCQTLLTLPAQSQGCRPMTI